jgi:insertion element IS1 protein InsB
MNNLRCPQCGLSHTKKNGHTHYRQQNYRCKRCGRQFVSDSQRVGNDTRALVKRLLLERVSLRGICRITGLSRTWLLQFIATIYERLPDDLCVTPASHGRRVHLLRLEAEVDELWSFVGKKADKRWLWLAFDKENRQVLAFYVGDRSRESARRLWQRILAAYRERATCYSDEGRRTRMSSPPSGLWPVARSRGSSAESSASTAPCGSGSRGWSASHSHFQRSWRITLGRSSTSSATTTGR